MHRVDVCPQKSNRSATAWFSREAASSSKKSRTRIRWSPNARGFCFLTGTRHIVFCIRLREATAARRSISIKGHWSISWARWIRLLPSPLAVHFVLLRQRALLTSPYIFNDCDDSYLATGRLIRSLSRKFVHCCSKAAWPVPVNGEGRRANQSVGPLGRHTVILSMRRGLCWREDFVTS
jgi:hypothetical protein